MIRSTSMQTRFALIAILVILGGLAFYFARSTADPLAAHAEAIIRTCKDASYRPSCYDKEIPKLMDRGLSMEEAFQTTSLVQDRDQDYFYCHVLGHKLSEQETAKDPGKWTEVIGRCPTGQCSNGCLHGAAQERFRSESLSDEQVRDILPQLAVICAGSVRDYTGLEEASCFHSLGHLTMYLTAGDINKAVAVCDSIAKPGGHDFTQVCYEGAYMQIFQPLEPEDFGLVRDFAPKTAAAAETYCKVFSGEYRAACHRESWPLYRASFSDPKKLEAFCKLMPGAAHEQRCFNALFYVMTAQYNFDQTKITNLCTGLSEAFQGQCFANAASRLIETDYRLVDRAADLCVVAEQYGEGNRCYEELVFYSSFNFHAGSAGHEALCRALPEPWRTSCSTGTQNHLPPPPSTD